MRATAAIVALSVGVLVSMLAPTALASQARGGGEKEGQEAEDPTAGTSLGVFLRPATKLGPDMLGTALSLQRHTEWVSAGEREDILATLQRKDIRLVGQGFIEPARQWEDAIRGIRAHVAVVGDNLVIAFRGTGASSRDNGVWSWLDAVVDLAENVGADASKRPGELEFITDSARYADRYRNIEVHRGFQRGYMSVRGQIFEAVHRHPNKRVFVTGFSLGAGLAMLCAFDLVAHNVRPRDRVFGYFLGTPRVGGDDFRRAFEESVPHAFRIAIHRDPVPRVPQLFRRVPRFFDYTHAGRLLLVGTDGAQIPLDDIEVTLRRADRSLHDRLLYYRALVAINEAAQQEEFWESAISLGDTADAERAATRGVQRSLLDRILGR